MGRDVDKLCGPDGTFLRLIVRSEEDRLAELEMATSGSPTLRHGHHVWQTSRGHHIQNAFKSPKSTPLQPDVNRVSAVPSTHRQPQVQQPPLFSPLKQTHPSATPVRVQNAHQTRDDRLSLKTLEEVMDQARQYPTMAAHANSQNQLPMGLGSLNGPSPAMPVNITPRGRLFNYRDPHSLVPPVGSDQFHQIHHYPAISPESYSRDQRPLATTLYPGPPPTMPVVETRHKRKPRYKQIPPDLYGQTEAFDAAPVNPTVRFPYGYPQSYQPMSTYCDICTPPTMPNAAQNQQPMSTYCDICTPPTMPNVAHHNSHLPDHQVRPGPVSHAEAFNEARPRPIMLPPNASPHSQQPMSTGYYTGSLQAMPVDGADHARRLLTLLNHPANVNHEEALKQARHNTDMPLNSSPQNQQSKTLDHPGPPHALPTSGPARSNHQVRTAPVTSAVTKDPFRKTSPAAHATREDAKALFRNTSTTRPRTVSQKQPPIAPGHLTGPPPAAPTDPALPNHHALPDPVTRFEAFEQVRQYLTLLVHAYSQLRLPFVPDPPTSSPPTIPNNGPGQSDHRVSSGPVNPSEVLEQVRQNMTKLTDAFPQFRQLSTAAHLAESPPAITVTTATPNPNQYEDRADDHSQATPAREKGRATGEFSTLHPNQSVQDVKNENKVSVQTDAQVKTDTHPQQSVQVAKKENNVPVKTDAHGKSDIQTMTYTQIMTYGQSKTEGLIGHEAETGTTAHSKINVETGLKAQSDIKAQITTQSPRKTDAQTKHNSETGTTAQSQAIAGIGIKAQSKVIPQTGATTRSETKTQSKPDPQAWTRVRSKTDASSNHNTETGIAIPNHTNGETRTKSQSDIKAQTMTTALAGTHSRSETKVGIRPNAQTWTKVESKTSVESKPNDRSKTQVQSKTYTESKSNVQRKAIAPSNLKVAQSSNRFQVLSKTEAQIWAENQRYTKAQAEIKAQAKASAQTRTDTHIGGSAQSGAGDRTKTDARIETETQVKMERRTKTVTQVETVAQAEIVARTETSAQTETEARVVRHDCTTEEPQIETINAQTPSDAQNETEAPIKADTQTQTQNRVETEAQPVRHDSMTQGGPIATSAQAAKDRPTETPAQIKANAQKSNNGQVKTIAKTQTETQIEIEAGLVQDAPANHSDSVMAEDELMMPGAPKLSHTTVDTLPDAPQDLVVLTNDQESTFVAGISDSQKTSPPRGELVLHLNGQPVGTFNSISTVYDAPSLGIPLPTSDERSTADDRPSGSQETGRPREQLVLYLDGQPVGSLDSISLVSNAPLHSLAIPTSDERSTPDDRPSGTQEIVGCETKWPDQIISLSDTSVNSANEPPSSPTPLHSVPAVHKDDSGSRDLGTMPDAEQKPGIPSADASKGPSSEAEHPQLSKKSLKKKKQKANKANKAASEVNQVSFALSPSGSRLTVSRP